MYYSDEIVEEVRMKNDIVDVISDYVKLQKKGSSYFGLCPFHNEKSPSFSVSPGKQMYYCFGCGAGGNVFTFIMEYENYTFVEALKYLAQRAGVTLPEAEYSKEAKAAADLRTTLLEIQKKAAAFYYYQLRQDTGKQGMAYLKGRELSDETIHKFGLGCSPRYSGALYQYLKNKGYSDAHLKESGLFNVDERRGMQDKFWNRVMFPIMDVNNRVIGFGGRVMGDAKPKYLNSPETKIFDKSRNLYGLNIARTSRKPYLIVCEGYMDVISMHQAGFTNAVASLGTALTSGHASLMSRYTKEVLLTYDSDEAGQKAALRGIPILKAAGIRPRVVNLAPYKDPDEFIKAEGKEAFEKRLEEAETKIFDKSRNLYGLNIARTSRKPYLIVCEGYMDVISMHQAGFTNAVASLGTALTSGHASLMSRYTKEVLLTYDSDEAGQKAALRGIPILKAAGIRPRVVNLAPYKDPDEFIKAEGKEAFEKRLEEASNAVLFEFSLRLRFWRSSMI